MKKLLSLLGSIGLTATSTVAAISCSVENIPKVDAQVSRDGKIVSFVTKITLPGNTDLSHMAGNYGVEINGQIFGNWGAEWGFSIELNNESDAGKFGPDKWKDKVTVDVLVKFNTFEELKQGKTYNVIFGKLDTSSKGYYKFGKRLAQVIVKMPKLLVLDSAKIDDKLQTITVKGENLSLAQEDAKWTINSANGFPDAPDETITVLDGRTDSELKLGLSVPLVGKMGTMMYILTCEQKGFFNAKVTFMVTDNNTDAKLYDASINYSADPASSDPGKMITITGDNLLKITRDQISKFKLSSKGNNVPDGEEIQWLPKGLAIAFPPTNHILYLWLTKPVLTPDTYTVTFDDQSVDFIIPSKPSPKFNADPTINDKHDQVSITGQNLLDTDVSHWAIRTQLGNIPNGLKLTIDSNSTDDKITFSLNKPLEDGWYYIEWSLGSDITLDSGLLEVKTNSGWEIPDNAQLNPGGSFVFGDGIYIEIYTKNIPGNNDCTKYITANGKPVKKAQEQSGILKVWLAEPATDGETINIVLTSGDVTLTTTVVNN